MPFLDIYRLLNSYLQTFSKLFALPALMFTGCYRLLRTRFHPDYQFSFEGLEMLFNLFVLQRNCYPFSLTLCKDQKPHL